MSTATITITDVTDGLDSEGRGMMAVMVHFEPVPVEGQPMPMTARAAMAAVEAISTMETTERFMDITHPTEPTDW